MKPKIQTIFNWLREKPGNIIEIHNAALGSCIDNRFTEEKAVPYGGIEKYFEHLYTNGARQINIVQKEKNGTSIKNKKAPISYTLLPVDGVPQNLFTPEAQQVQQKAQNDMGVGLMGAAQSIGLSQAQVFDMHTASKRLPEVQEDLRSYRSKCEALEAKVKELERDNLKYELGILGKESGGEKFLNAIADPDNLKGIATIIGEALVKTREAKAGLAQPQQPQAATSSDLKNSLIAIIANDKMTEAQALGVYHVADRIGKGDQIFIDSLALLLDPKNPATDA